MGMFFVCPISNNGLFARFNTAGRLTIFFLPVNDVCG